MKFENVFSNLMKTMKEKEEYFKQLREDLSASEETLKEIIEQLDMLESMRLQLTEDLENAANKYKEIKDEVSKKKLDLNFIQVEDLTADLNRLLNNKEIEEKAEAAVKRNTTKRNVDKRIEQLTKELDDLNIKKADVGYLEGEEAKRYKLLPELLKEFNDVVIK